MRLSMHGRRSTTWGSQLLKLTSRRITWGRREPPSVGLWRIRLLYPHAKPSEPSEPSHGRNKVRFARIRSHLDEEELKTLF